MKYAQNAYRDNVKRFLNPAMVCVNSDGRDVILRCLDPGSHGGADSGYGRACVGTGEIFRRGNKHNPDTQQTRSPDIVPTHIFNKIKEEADKDDIGRDFVDVLTASCHATEVFP